MKKNNMYVGMDTDKNSIDVAVGEEGRNKEVRHYGRIENNLAALDKLVRKLESLGHTLHFVYEAGPCGYTIYRHLTGKGIDCAVVAPSQIPKRSGERVKTNRRDALNLARLHRAGELHKVYVPLPEDEAMRDLSRAREDAKRAEVKAKQQLSAFLLRNGFKFRGKTAWSNAYRRWLNEIKLSHPAQQIAFQEYRDAVDDAHNRVERIAEEIRTLLPAWRLSPVVEALQAMRGVSLITALITIAELGDLTRFSNPKQLMAYLGLVPSEYSTGNKRRQGSITKTGNSSARRALTEAAWSYNHPARVSRAIDERQKNLPKAIKEIAWKAQLRLCARYRRLVNKGKNKQVVITAVARELAAFIWAIACQVKVNA
jgi:transposase